MKQVWRTLLAIFAPLGSLVRVLDVILTWADEIDSLLHDPDLSPDFHTDEGRRTLEGQVAYGEHWVNILTAARTAELLGLRRTARFDMAWSFWRPHTPCSWDSLMQRYQRMRMSFAAIECNAQRRAARIKPPPPVCDWWRQTTAVLPPPVLRTGGVNAQR